MLSAAHVRTLVWPGANMGDGMNLLNDTMMTVNGTTLSWKAPATNESQFIALFEAYPTGGSRVDFQSSGLPNGTRWYLGVGASTLESTGSDIPALLPQGSFALTPFTYPVWVNSTGLPPGATFDLVLAGQSLAVSGGPQLLLQSNGTFAWAVIPTAGYRVSPSHGNFTLAGGSAALSLVFTAASASTGGGASGGGSTRVMLEVALGIAVAAVLVAASVLWLSTPRRPKDPAPRAPPVRT